MYVIGQHIREAYLLRARTHLIMSCSWIELEKSFSPRSN